MIPVSSKYRLIKKCETVLYFQIEPLGQLRFVYLLKKTSRFFKKFPFSILIMPIATEERIVNVGKILNDSSRPMKERFRALFTLKNIKGELALKYIGEAFSDDSDLLKHELAYCLGQMQDPNAIPILVKVLEDVKEVPMVRHEAGKFW